MLPCQSTCSHYAPGCHKTCRRWKAEQASQSMLRRRKKEYLQYYNELCATVARQFSAMNLRPRSR